MLDDIFDTKVGTPESDESDLPAFLIESFESQYHFIDSPDAVGAIKIQMEGIDQKQMGLVGMVGEKVAFQKYPTEK